MTLKDDPSKFNVNAVMQRERMIGMPSICRTVRHFPPDSSGSPDPTSAHLRLLGSV
jgi:hypothetical protein